MQSWEEKWKPGLYFIDIFFSDATCFFRKEIGTWSSGLPGRMTFKSGMKEKLIHFRNKNVLRVVTVLQAPFMQKQNTTRKFHNRNSIELN